MIVKEEGLSPLFERKRKIRVGHKLLVSTIFVGICFIWIFRIVCIPKSRDQGRYAWIGMFMAELIFGLFWILTQSLRWNLTHCYPFKDRLSHRYEDHKLPGIDVFVCTADPTMEPPMLVTNTVLSIMSYNYPTEKLSVYVSDDGGSDLTFYALLEASQFSKHWIPFCKAHNIEPRSPEAYLSQHFNLKDFEFAQQVSKIQKLYAEMKMRIETMVERGTVSKELRSQHKGFSEWNNCRVTSTDHPPIVQIIIDGRDTTVVDNNGCRLPTLLYMAREKRPHFPHNFKAGAMNALIRVSSEISNGSIILNLDCDMYANDADAIRDALCFFMDEERGHEIAYVQHPQNYNNITNNDLYGNDCRAVNQVELAGMGGYDAALYCGTGCFHRRKSLSGKYYYSKENKENCDINYKKKVEKTVNEVEEASKVLASCSYEDGTQWGKEMGLVYGCAVEDIVTGLAIQCKGWKSMYYCPKKEAFLGVAPNTLDLALIQHKRWSEGLFQIFFSKYCPFIYGNGKIKLGAQMGYCVYLLWAPLSLPMLYYVVIPPLYLLQGIPLFPQVTSLWFIPFAYAFLTNHIHSILEALSCGYTLKGWWNLQRMRLFRRTTSYFLAFIDIIIKRMGFSSELAFAITAKVVTDDVLERYGQEVMEFGSSNAIMFTIIATLAMLNLFALVGSIFIKRVVLEMDFKALEMVIPHVMLCGLVVVVNFPVYHALFVRNDKGSLPSSITLKSIAISLVACLICLPMN